MLLFIPMEKLIFKTLEISFSRATISLSAITLATLVLIYFTGLLGIMYLALSAFCLWAFIFGFLVDRKYPYILALTFLVSCPFLLIANLDSIAELMAVLAYLCLVLGVIKDMFHDKVVEGNNNE